MLKLRVMTDNGPILVLGLSATNIERLQDGMPIKVNLAEMGLQGQVFIFTGATEDSMLKELQDAGLVPAMAAEGTPQ